MLVETFCFRDVLTLKYVQEVQQHLERSLDAAGMALHVISGRLFLAFKRQTMTLTDTYGIWPVQASEDEDVREIVPTRLILRNSRFLTSVINLNERSSNHYTRPS